MHQVQLDCCILETQEVHYLTIYTPKHYDGDFIVRIEDTDINRNVEGGEQSQLELLEWLGIDIDESPIHGGATVLTVNLKDLICTHNMQRNYLVMVWHIKKKMVPFALKYQKARHMCLMILLEDNFHLRVKM